MKILSFQPFSIYDNGGGARILRRLYEGHEEEIVSLALSLTMRNIVKGSITEWVVYTFPIKQSWLKSFIRTFVFWLDKSFLRSLTAVRLQKQATKINFDILHVVDHGRFSDALCTDLVLKNKQLWTSFHDYFSTSGSSFKAAKILWNQSDRRLVISEELGNKYEELFGKRGYEIITDGLYHSEISIPVKTKRLSLKIYFAGLLHIDYYPLFKTLADALDQISSELLYSFVFVLRGTQRLSFLDKRSFIVEYRPFTLNAMELKAELDDSDILYLPIKFTEPYFYEYSLSTKMIGYLGASGTILYHGPFNSAANKLLSQHKAASSCFSLKVDDLTKAILNIKQNPVEYSENAKRLAAENFLLSKIRKQFLSY